MYVRFLRPKEWASERASEKEGRGDTSLCQWRLHHGESLWRKKFYETGLKNFLEFFNKKQYIYPVSFYCQFSFTLEERLKYYETVQSTLTMTFSYQCSFIT